MPMLPNNILYEPTVCEQISTSKRKDFSRSNASIEVWNVVIYKHFTGTTAREGNMQNLTI